MCNMSTTRSDHKPTGEEVSHMVRTGQLRKPRKTTVKNLAGFLVDGGLMRASAIDGDTSNKFISQQVFMLDFDNKVDFISFNDAKNRAIENGLKIAFAYRTFSDTQETPKFRIVFILNEEVRKIEDRDILIRYLLNVFQEADQSCRDVARIFYGTNNKNLLYEDYESRNDITDLLNRARRHFEANPMQYKEEHKKTPRTEKYKVTEIRKSDHLHLVKSRYAQALKLSLDCEKKVFESQNAFYNYVYRDVDMVDFFGLDAKEGRNFSCILEGHADKNPSANVYKGRDGAWLYHCFACGKTFNLVQLVEHLGNFNSDYQVLKFLKECLNVEIEESEKVKQAKFDIDRIASKVLKSNCEPTEFFDQTCPKANKNIECAKLTFLTLLFFVKDHDFGEDFLTEDNEIRFFISERYLAKIMNKLSLAQVHRHLNVLKYHEMIIPINVEDLPEDIMKNAKKNRKQYNTVSFYKIKPWTINHLTTIEKNGTRWQDNHYTMKGVSFESIARTEGQETALKVFPQHRPNKKRSHKVEQSLKLIDLIITSEINEKGYCIEKDIVKELTDKYGYSREKADYRLKQNIPHLIDKQNIRRVRLNKQLKSDFNINEKGFPFVIISGKQ